MSIPEDVEKQPLPPEEEKIRYRIMKKGLFNEDVSFNSLCMLVKGFHQFENKRRRLTISKQFKFNSYFER